MDFGLRLWRHSVEPALRLRPHLPYQYPTPYGIPMGPLAYVLERCRLRL